MTHLTCGTVRDVELARSVHLEHRGEVLWVAIEEELWRVPGHVLVTQRQDLLQAARAHESPQPRLGVLQKVVLAALESVATHIQDDILLGAAVTLTC